MRTDKLCKEIKAKFDKSMANFRAKIKQIDERENMKTEDIVLTLENGEKLRLEMQHNFRNYVQDKKICLRKRFAVWSKLCVKIMHHRNNIVLFEKLGETDLYVPGYDYITWQDVLHMADSENEKEQIMQLLIDENFGIMDVRSCPISSETDECIDPPNKTAPFWPSEEEEYNGN